MSALVAILIPVLHRPWRVPLVLASITDATTEPHEVWFIGSPDEHAEREAVKAAGGAWMQVAVGRSRGDYARKINLGLQTTSAPYVFLGADDLAFHPGWLEAALGKMGGKIGVVGTNDLGNQRVIAGEHATHSLVSRKYARQGTIDDKTKLLHEGYPHEFVDDEFVETARSRDAFAHAADSIVEHLHPHWGKAPSDHIYAAAPERLRVGRRLYRERCSLWGGDPTSR